MVTLRDLTRDNWVECIRLTLDDSQQSDTEWYYKVVPATLTFEVNDDGKCIAVELFQNGAKIKAKRMDE